MNMYNNKNLIEEFLTEVEEKLPSWLKVNEDDTAEVLRELEEHIDELAAQIWGLTEEELKEIQTSLGEMA